MPLLNVLSLSAAGVAVVLFCLLTWLCLAVATWPDPRHTWHALLAALLKLSLMTVGWMPFSSSSCAFLSSAPQMTTTDVVPSPATMSYMHHRQCAKEQQQQQHDHHHMSMHLDQTATIVEEIPHLACVQRSPALLHVLG